MIALRGYQTAAVDAIVAGLAHGGRGQCIAACGTGKTLVAMHAALALCPPDGVIVVACPSLALVAQLLGTWTAHAAPPLSPLAVCGDDTVADSLVTHAADLSCPVTTDPAHIARWVTATPGRRLIVTTHASAGIAGSGLKLTASSADILIVDEAHITAGYLGKHSALLHDDARFPAQRRLYLTATPRYASAGLTGASGAQDDLISMDDEAVFGPELFRYSFAQAIEDGWLDDYRVAVIGVTRSDVLALLRRLDDKAVTDEHDPPLRTAVVQAALAKAAVQFDLQRVIVFTPRVALAHEFARSLPRTIARLPEDDRPTRPLTAGALDGRMTVAQREGHLERLKHPPSDGWTVLANARCLSLGVDVPAVDAVLFTAPKRSTIDVIQSVGRALRRHPAGTGVSTILVPILLPSDDAPATPDDDDQYATLWQVLRALRAHDETLGAELDTQRVKSTTSHPELPARILIRLPDGYDSEQFLHHVTLRLITATTPNWLDGLAAARAYHTQHGHLRVPATHVDASGYALGQWISRQRTLRRRSHLATDHEALLNQLGMLWDPRAQQWQDGVAAAAAYHRDHGHLRVPRRHVTADGYLLGEWISRMRGLYSHGDLAPERAQRLEQLGMTWDDSDWARGITAARAYHARHGHLSPPKDHREGGLDLHEWLITRRTQRRRGHLPQARIDELTELEIVWSPYDRQWERALAAARAFAAQHGHLQPPPSYDPGPGEINLRTWVHNRRSDYHAGRLPPERVTALETLGMVWTPHDAAWERGLAAARAYHATHGHLRPRTREHVDGIDLASWVNRHRGLHRLGQLPAPRVAALDAVGMQWNVPKGPRPPTT